MRDTALARIVAFDMSQHNPQHRGFHVRFIDADGGMLMEGHVVAWVPDQFVRELAERLGIKYSIVHADDKLEGERLVPTASLPPKSDTRAITGCPKRPYSGSPTVGKLQTPKAIEVGTGNRKRPVRKLEKGGRHGKRLLG